MVCTIKEIYDNWMDPDFKFFVNRNGGVQERMKFLLRDENMKEEYLGACLDYIRWGGQETVMYELGTKGMINFIQHWMDLNKNNLIWNEKNPSKNFTLPYLKHKRCPKDENHRRTIKDLSGKIRCAHESEKRLKPSFVRSFSYFDEDRQANIVDYEEDEPRSILPEEAWDENTGKLLDNYQEEWGEYQEQIKKFKEEEPTFIVNDICYAILSDEENILSLEKILDRLNLQPRMRTVYCISPYNVVGRPCQRLDELNKDEREIYELLGFCSGHKEENNETIHPFSGWKLALYVQKWYEQFADGQALVFEK